MTTRIQLWMGVLLAGASAIALADCTTTTGHQFVLYEVAGANSTTSCNGNKPALIDATNDALDVLTYAATPPTVTSPATGTGLCADTTNFPTSATYYNEMVEMLSQNNSKTPRTPPSAWFQGATVTPANTFHTVQIIGSTVCKLASGATTHYYCKLCVAP